MSSRSFSRFTFLLLTFTLWGDFTLGMEMVVPHNEDIQKKSLIPDHVFFDERILGSEISLNSEVIKSTSETDLPSVFQAFDQDLVLFLSQFLKLETLVSFSRVDNFYREFLYRSKLQHFLSAPAYTLPAKNTYSLAKLLKKIALDERFLYGEVFAENSKDLRPSEKERKQLEDKNNKIILDCLNRSKSMHYSPTFRQLNGPLYRDEIASRRGERLNLGYLQEVKALFLSTRHDPVIMYANAAVLSALFLTVFYDVYANFNQSHYRYGLYMDHENCLVYYAKAPIPILGGYYVQTTIPLCPQNVNQEMVFKADESMWVNGQNLKQQLMMRMLLTDVHVFTLLCMLFKLFVRFFGF